MMPLLFSPEMVDRIKHWLEIFPIRQNRFMVAVALLLMGSFSSYGQFGTFIGRADWGRVGDAHMGGSYSERAVNGKREIILRGNGDDIGNGVQDEGFFLFNQATGSHSLQARFLFMVAYSESKVGVMVRERAQEMASRYYWIYINAKGNDPNQVEAQWRPVEEAWTGDVSILDENGDPVRARGEGIWLRLTRILPLELFFTEYSHDGLEWHVANDRVLEQWDQNMAFGAAITSHHPGTLVSEAKIDLVAAVDVPSAGLRHFSNSSATPGEQLTITIPVYTSPGASELITVEEIVPAGWQVLDTHPAASIADQVLSWQIEPQEEIVTLNYTVAVPEEPRPVPLWKGRVGTYPIFGDDTLPVVSPSPDGDEPFQGFTVISDGWGSHGAADVSFQDETYHFDSEGMGSLNASDNLAFLFGRYSGNFTVAVDLEPSDGQIGLMIRDDIHPSSAMGAIFLIPGEEGHALQCGWRDSALMDVRWSEGNTSELSHRVEIERKQNRIFFHGYTLSGDKQMIHEVQLNTLQNSVYVGISSSSGQNDLVLPSSAKNFAITGGVPVFIEEWALY